MAETVALSTACLCEYVWTLRGRYKIKPTEIAASLRVLVVGLNVVCENDAVDAGLQFLDAGGDFADGAIFATGRKLGGEVFVTFDGQAARIARSFGLAALRP